MEMESVTDFSNKSLQEWQTETPIPLEEMVPTMDAYNRSTPTPENDAWWSSIPRCQKYAETAQVTLYLDEFIYTSQGGPV